MASTPVQDPQEDGHNHEAAERSDNQGPIPAAKKNPADEASTPQKNDISDDSQEAGYSFVPHASGIEQHQTRKYSAGDPRVTWARWPRFLDTQYERQGEYTPGDSRVAWAHFPGAFGSTQVGLPGFGTGAHEVPSTQQFSDHSAPRGHYYTPKGVHVAWASVVRTGVPDNISSRPTGGGHQDTAYASSSGAAGPSGGVPYNVEDEHDSQGEEEAQTSPGPSSGPFPDPLTRENLERHSVPSGPGRAWNAARNGPQPPAREESPPEISASQPRKPSSASAGKESKKRHKHKRHKHGGGKKHRRNCEDDERSSGDHGGSQSFGGLLKSLFGSK